MENVSRRCRGARTVALRRAIQAKYELLDIVERHSRLDANKFTKSLRKDTGNANLSSKEATKTFDMLALELKNDPYGVTVALFSTEVAFIMAPVISSAANSSHEGQWKKCKLMQRVWVSCERFGLD